MNATMVVEGVEIPQELIAEEAQHHPAATPAEARAHAAQALAIKTLLLGRARELGLKCEPALHVDGSEDTEEEALISAVLDREIEVLEPDIGECRRVYEARTDRFHTPALYEASHILFETQSDDPATSKAAYYAASRALAAQRDGLAGFEDLARTLSDCPSGKVGGSLGQLAPGDLAREIEAALGKLDPGDLAPSPIRSRFGWHILRLDRRAPAQRLPFEAVRERIRLHLQSRAWIAAASSYVADMVERSRMAGISMSLRSNGAVDRPATSLGDLLGAEGLASRLRPWLQAVDPALAAKVDAAAQRQGLSGPAFVQRAVADFVAAADDESWTRVVSATRHADDPALGCVAALLKNELTPKSRGITVIRTVWGPPLPVVP